MMCRADACLMVLIYNLQLTYSLTHPYLNCLILNREYAFCGTFFLGEEIGSDFIVTFLMGLCEKQAKLSNEL